MFHHRQGHMNHQHGFVLLTLASLAMTVPFICVAGNVARSLREISRKLDSSDQP